MLLSYCEGLTKVCAGQTNVDRGTSAHTSKTVGSVASNMIREISEISNIRKVRKTSVRALQPSVSAESASQTETC